MAALLLLAASLPAAAAPVAHMKAEATVEGAAIRLGDVARIAGTKAEVLALSAVEVGPSPLPGNVRSVSADMIRIKMRQAKLDPTALATDPTLICRVTRASQTLSADALIQAALEYVQANLEPGPGKTTLEPAYRPRERQLPTGKLELTVEPFGAATSGSTRQVWVNATVDGQPCGRDQVSLKLHQFASVAVAKGTIAKGQAVDADHVAYVEKDRMSLSPDAILEGDSLDGMVATQAIGNGFPLTHRDVAEPSAIHRGDNITLQARTGGIMVSVPGVAMEDGRVGASIRVKNTVSNTDTRATVIDGKTAEAAL